MYIRIAVVGEAFVSGKFDFESVRKDFKFNR